MAPGGKIMVYFAGLTMILAAVSILIGKYDKLACVLLAVQMLLYVVLVHAPGLGSADEAAKQMSTMSLLKDVIIMGGALMAAGQAKDNAIIG